MSAAISLVATDLDGTLLRSDATRWGLDTMKTGTSVGAALMVRARSRGRRQ